MFGDRFNGRRQGVAWPGLVAYLEFSVAFEQEIDGVQWPALCRNSPLAAIINRALGRGTWPSTLKKWIIVSDDFEHSTVGITSFIFRASNRGVDTLCVLSNFELLAAAF